MGLFANYDYKKFKSYHRDFIETVLLKYCDNVKLLDNYYRLISVSEIGKILEYKIDTTDYGKYELDFNDCNRIRIMMLGDINKIRKGLAVGICDIKDHALLCFLDYDLKLWLLDNNKSIREVKENEIIRIEF